MPAPERKPLTLRYAGDYYICEVCGQLLTSKKGKFVVYGQKAMHRTCVPAFMKKINERLRQRAQQPKKEAADANATGTV